MFLLATHVTAWVVAPKALTTPDGVAVLHASDLVKLQEHTGQEAVVRGRVDRVHSLDGQGTRAYGFSRHPEGFQVVVLGAATESTPYDLTGRYVEVSGYVDLAGRAPRIYVRDPGYLRVLD